MLLSIIIPFFNGNYEDTLRCLNSISNQNLDSEDYEVIIVNDCSSNLSSIEALIDFSESSKIKNFKIIHHKENTRQGGARNTGVREAKGKYIQYIDQDDFFVEGSLKKLYEILKKDPSIDIYMMDLLILNVETNVFSGPSYEKNPIGIFKGEEFLLKAEVPWVPWQYCYRKDFLISNNIYFVEHVRFEDVDYVLKATLLAKSIIYISFPIIVHTESNTQTSFIGNDSHKIIDLVKISYRIRLLSENYQYLYPEGSKVIMNHHTFGYDSFIKKYLWRLKPSKFLYLIKQYPPKTPSNFKLLNFVSKHPKIFIYTCTALRPFLKGARIIIISFREKKH